MVEYVVKADALPNRFFTQFVLGVQNVFLLEFCVSSRV